MTSKVEGTIHVTNDQPEEISLRLEPWGDEQRIPSGRTVGINLQASSEVQLHIFTSPGVLELWTEAVDLALEFRSE
jgi:hypothetical protein